MLAMLPAMISTVASMTQSNATAARVTLSALQRDQDRGADRDSTYDELHPQRRGNLADATKEEKPATPKGSG